MVEIGDIAMGDITNYISDEIAENVIKDYYTAGIKAEVILDMLLTPVIREILAIGRVSDIENLRFGTKEFPLVKVEQEEEGEKRQNNQNDVYRSVNVDYLLWNRNTKTIYLVELKTTPDSINDDQIENYKNKLKKIKGRTFGESLGREFVEILNKYSCTGISENGLKKEWGPSGKCDNKQLRRIFKCILSKRNYCSKAPERNEKQNVEDNEASWENEKGKNVQLAKCYLKKEKAYGTKKYLLQAGQLLDAGVEEIWGSRKIQMVYIIPDSVNDDKLKNNGIKPIHLIDIVDLYKNKKEKFWDIMKIEQEHEEILNQANASERKRRYIDWLFGKVLVPLFSEGSA